jgi:putative flippase GtrA
MYALLLMTGPGLVFANIGARLISSAANYTINRKFVFRSGKNVTASAVQYFALAAFILAGNTFVLHTMVASLGINSMAAKILTEVLFFMISWTVQRYVVFYDGSEADRSETGMSRGEKTGGRFQIGYTAVRPKKLKAVRSREESRAEA